VAEAIQAAHTRGVIHRDLKPGNILVAPEEGGLGQPKVLDFDVARLTNADLQVTSVKTETSQLIGTLQYMSPKQLGGDSRHVDARSDVYSLGVIACELLAGRRPFNLGGLSLVDAVTRLQNTRPASLGAAAEGVSSDVELIVATAMEWDPERRYQTAAELAADIRRYLRREPILARPPSATYQFRKFVQRNRTLVAAVAAIALSLLGGTVAATVGFASALRQRDAARLETAKAESVSRFLTEMLSSIDPDTAKGQDVSVGAVVEDSLRRLDRGELADQPAVRTELLSVIGRSLGALGRYPEAIDRLGEALAITEEDEGASSAETARALDRLAIVETEAGLYADAERHFGEAIATREAIGTPSLVGDGAASLGTVYFWTGRLAEGERFFRDAVAQLERTSSEPDDRLAQATGWLGAIMERRGDLEQAVRLHRKALALERALHGEVHTAVASALNNLGNALEAVGDYEAAREAHEESLRIKRELLRPDHPDIAASLSYLGVVLVHLGEPEAAERVLREAVEIRRKVLGDRHPSTAISLLNLAWTVQELGRHEEALALFDEAIRIADVAVGDGDVLPIILRINRARCLVAMGRFEEAEPILLDGYERVVAMLGPEHRRAGATRGYIVDMYEAWGRPDDADRWRDAPNRQAGPLTKD
jgi:tetratricopeptide (TPR) repeat protein